MQTLWTVGYVLGEIPSNMILTRVRPSIWIPLLEVFWTILTFCTSRCNTAEQLYAVRFLVGLAEAGFYPGMQYLIGSWYRKDELAKRSCILHAGGHVASMFSGYLMAAVYNLEGVHGYRGWQVRSQHPMPLRYEPSNRLPVALSRRWNYLPPHRSPGLCVPT
jgi:ACS family pantothenate transporter-like MFS transporter